MPRAAREYNTTYEGDRLGHIAFPMGGIGAGMICLEGTGALSHVSLRNKPDVFNEPTVFSAVCVTGRPNVARVLEGPVPEWKVFGPGGSGRGHQGKTYGLPRFQSASFLARFPFAAVNLTDEAIPLKVEVTGWSPFIPGDADSSSLPVAALEYRFTNPTDQAIEAVYSFNSRNFMSTGSGGDAIRETENGFVLWQPPSPERPWEQGAFSATVLSYEAKVDCAWFRGGWFDALTMVWNAVANGRCIEKPPVTEGDPSPGASIFVPFELAGGEKKTITVLLAWHVPDSDIRSGADPDQDKNSCGESCNCRNKKPNLPTHEPWYSARFPDVRAVMEYWRRHYETLRKKTRCFTECFYDTTLPDEVTEAVAANLTILKSPTVLRQADGRLWCWEGCCDSEGCCAGSCTHVWNYAQALPHLFGQLERTLRETEFDECQDERGHQTFRASLPIRPTNHDFHAAADGQLGGIMKVYRDWRISGDTDWIRGFWPKVKASLNYCIETWDPDHKGLLVEPHHNTYDIEFWGPDGMCGSFYLGALKAAVNMGKALGEDVSSYESLLEKGRKHLEEQLFNSEYFYQEVVWRGLRASDPTVDETPTGENCPSPESVELIRKEGPKYQYGNGCLSDGVLGAWMACVCGVGEFLDREKVKSHLLSVYRYNFRKDLSGHANPQRSGFAIGREGGLLLCSWPRGSEPLLPFPYSNEVWTGIEYQVASHLMMLGYMEEGLEIVRTCRDRYDGRVRNPFNEYECGHWYARAMSSYALIQGLTGVRYDAVEKTLYIQPRIEGDFRSFLSTATGYGTVRVKNGEPFVEVKSGEIEIERIEYQPVEKNLS